jgi:uncharacterized protein
VWDILTAIGLVLAVEGLLYAAFPGGMKRAMLQIMDMPLEKMRMAGLLAAILGVAIVWLVRGSGIH